MNRQRLQVVDKLTLLGNSLSRAVHLDDEVTAIIDKASVASMEMSGIEMESGLEQSLKSAKPWNCQPSYMHVRPGQYTNAMPKDAAISTYAA